MTNRRIHWRNHFIELVVVVIGISIAFWLNNWNEAKKDHKTEKNYLNSLVIDLEKDIIEMERVIDSTNVLIRSTGELFGILYQKGDPLSKIKRHHITNTYTVPYFNAKNGTYLSLVNSGALDIIRGFDLRSSITQLYHIQYKEIERADGFIKNLSNGLVYPYMLKNIQFSLRADGITDARPLKTNEAINFLGSYFNFLKKRVSVYEKVKADCENLKSKIENQLNQ